MASSEISATSSSASHEASSATESAQKTQPSKNVTANTTVSSVADLKKKAPEVYNAMLQGIAIHICQEMQHHQSRLKQLMREGRQNAGQ